MDGFRLFCFGFVGAVTNALWAYSEGQAWFQIVMAYSGGGTVAMTLGTAVVWLFGSQD